MSEAGVRLGVAAARRLVKRWGAATASIALVGTLCLSPAAAAAATWSIAQSATPVGDQGTLVGVSCTAASECMAVGYAADTSGRGAMLAEENSGAGWAILATPNPSGALGSELFGVSCTSSTTCTAVGIAADSSGTDVTLAEVWDGTTWSTETTPDPTGSEGSGLSGVSCTSATACTAVGNYVNSSGTEVTLAEAWNGRTWATEATPDPSGALGSELYGVSCTSATACAAVGSYTNKYGEQVNLAEGRNGTKWVTETTSNPGGSQDFELSGVSCTAATACTAVGQYLSSSGEQVTLAEAWSGTKWATQPTINPTGALASQLSAVSCTLSTACTAVGSSDGLTIAEAWNGTKWAIETTPNPAGPADSQLSALSCTASTACTAVGSSDGVTLAEASNGTTWAIETTPNPTGAEGSELSAISCTSTTTCTAVGSYSGSSATGVTLAEAWNGTSWAIETTPDPTGAQDSELSGVSCASATSCMGVGSFVDTDGGQVALTEAWDGTMWTIEKTPTPTGSDGSELSAVSCASVSFCMAAGSSGGVMLVESWNGTKWAIKKTFSPSGAESSQLSGVSCASATACTAVGMYINSSRTQVTLAEAWNGKSWSTKKSPNPTGAESSQLSGVSCASATACTAVGMYFNSSGSATLAETWNGKSWAIKKSTNPAGGQFLELSAVSCASVTACTAVGSYFNSSGSVTLAEAWNGKNWATQTTPDPSGSTGSELSGVSCTTSACIAAGSTRYDVGVGVPLVESST